MKPPATAFPVQMTAISRFRTQFVAEMNCQIVHDSLHRREGWTENFALAWDGLLVGFGVIAVSGPWKDKPTVFEFYVGEERREQTFDLFEAFQAASGAKFLRSSKQCYPAVAHAPHLRPERGQ